MKRKLSTLFVAVVMVFTMGLSVFPQTVQAGTWNGIDVATIQIQLNNWLTYNPGYNVHGYLVVDGSYGSMTKTVVADYQRARGIKPIDGSVGTNTWSYLKNENVWYALETQRAVNIALMMKGNQTHIKEDGLYGKETHDAVALVQKLYGLNPQDGIAGDQTWRKVLSSFVN